MNITGMTPSAICSLVSSVAVIFSFSAAWEKIERKVDKVKILVSIFASIADLTFLNPPLEKLSNSSTRLQHMLQGCHMEIDRNKLKQ